MFTQPSLDGQQIFGAAVRMQVIANPSESQVNTFFGVDGMTNVWGGSRGRTIMVEGLLYAPDIATLNAAETLFMSFNDFKARTLVDTRGRPWPNVVFKGEFAPDPMGPLAILGGWGLPYKAIFRGLA